MDQACEEKRRTDLLEALAELEHNQWMKWSLNLADNEEHLSQRRLDRWKICWKPYRDLPEIEKGADRIWAEKVLFVLKKHLGIR